MNDDDISEFGATTVDPTVLCTTNEIRGSWVLLIGELPFKIEDIRSFRWNMRIPRVVGCSLHNQTKIDCEQYPEKYNVLGEAQELVHKKSEADLNARLKGARLQTRPEMTLRARVACAVDDLRSQGIDVDQHTDRPVGQLLFMGGCGGED